MGEIEILKPVAILFGIPVYLSSEVKDRIILVSNEGEIHISWIEIPDKKTPKE